MVLARPGTSVVRGDTLAEVQAHDAGVAANVVARVRSAIRIGHGAVPTPTLVRGRIEAHTGGLPP
jgi:thymidine phosphorylase